MVKNRTTLIKWLMQQSNLSRAEMAEYLGCSRGYFNNKLTRNSFSIDDLMIAAYAAGYSVKFIHNVDDQKSSTIGFVDFFKENEVVLQRVREINNNRDINRRKEYESLKAELAKIKETYGFED